MLKVQFVHTDNGYYLIPNDLVKQFKEDLNHLITSGFYNALFDNFTKSYNQYYTGNDLNFTQLYVEDLT